MSPIILLEIFLIGFLAQMVDGTLGMGYGVTSSAVLVFLGVPPPVASASVHTSEIFTTFANGSAHFKFGNVRKDIFWPLVLPGVIGGVIGASCLLSLPLRPARVIIGIILFFMGIIIFYRFMFRSNNAENKTVIKKYNSRKIGALGFLAAFIDAAGGGGWGPICTPSLVMTGTEAHKAVGTVNFVEFFVTLAIALTFLIFMGGEHFRWEVVLALIMGGIIAAPLAAFSCKKLPKRLLGILVGTGVIILSVRMII